MSRGSKDRCIESYYCKENIKRTSTLLAAACLNPIEASFTLAVEILDDTADQLSPAACQALSLTGLRRVPTPSPH